MSQEKYGIWLTLTSLVAWFTLFDVGLGQGLRNKLAEAIARNDLTLAKIYVATTYAVLSGIACILCLGIIIVAPLLNWAAILNASQDLSTELSFLAVVVFLSFSVRFVTSLINVVLIADQKTWITQAIEAIGGLITLGGVLLVTMTPKGSLISLGVTLSIISASVPLAASAFFFSGRYKWLRPRISFVRVEYFRELASIGGKFFFLQVTFILQFSVQNILISQLIGPSEVVAYNVAFKYFSVVIMFYVTAMIPLWSAFTEAFAKGDMPWIKATMRRVVNFWFIVAAACIVMLILSPLVYRLWVGPAVRIDFLLSLFIAFYVLVVSWNTSFTFFVNGVGKVKLQMLFAVVSASMNVPLSFLFVRYANMGSSGIILATVLCILPGAILTPMQYSRIVKGTARGIWNA